MNNNYDKNSRRLAYALRHDEKIKRVKEGWVAISDIIKISGFSLELLTEIVNADSKHRFEINHVTTHIRALYGHSQPVDMNYREAIPPEYLIHGTSKDAVASILKNGIHSRSRQYVHLSDDRSKAIETGRRHGESKLLYVMARKMYAHDYKFYNPVPGVWLVDEVPVEFIDANVTVPDSARLF